MMNKENSGWDPTIAGQNADGTLNGAQGLFQFKPETFLANAAPGHTNINSSTDQTLALINRINKTYSGSFDNIPGFGTDSYTGW